MCDKHSTTALRKEYSSHQIRSGFGSAENLAGKVRDHYEELTPANQREVEFSSNPVHSKRLNSDYQHIKRMVEGRQKMPLDLFVPFLKVLDPKVARDIIQTVCTPLGLMAVSQPNYAAGEGKAISDAALLREVADVFEARDTLMADGQIDAGDGENIRKARLEIQEAMAVLKAFDAQLAEVEAQPAPGTIHIVEGKG